MKPYSEIASCRTCGSTDLVPVLSLGDQALTGVFPRDADQPVTVGPLDLVKCGSGPDTCGLVQLKQTYDKRELYGASYGYHSSLNASMVAHLRRKVRHIEAFARPDSGDLIIDIGSNDGTLLKCYKRGPRLIGIDPTGAKFSHFYPSHVELVTDFFSAAAVRERTEGRKAKVITSIAMFYDLDAPLEFMAEVSDLLADDGIWVLEQSYLPSMVTVNAYDTICHEHLEYYGLRQIQWMAERVGLRIVEVELNSVNGGSFSVTIAKEGAPIPSRDAYVRVLLAAEAAYADLAVYGAFRDAVAMHRDLLLELLLERREAGESVLGYGASTKGNVILQYCGITREHLPAIGEVNPDKFGCFTPGSLIPIVPEQEVRGRRPDHLLVFPWHFKSFLVEKERPFLESGGSLIFPLPEPHIHRL